MENERTILHCDCNSFFASVETVSHPEYACVPMAVCGSTEERHGIVLAKNELAKKYGIKTAETVWSAKKKCPDLVIAEPHYGEYVKFSRAVNRIYAEYTDEIEPFGIDESWLDVTKSRKAFGTGVEIAEVLRRRIREEIGITISVGVSFNKIFAKLGSDYKKPDATTVIDRENFKSIVYPLPVGDLLFVGRRTEEALLKMGVRTIGDLAEVSPALLTARFGKMGQMLHLYAVGEDDSPVTPPTEDAKSIGNGFTFRHDLVGRDACRLGIDFLSEEIGEKLRARGQKCTTVTLRVKDEFLTTVQKQKQLAPPTDLSREIAAAAYTLLASFWSPEKPVRMLTVTASGLVRRDAVTEQLDLFSDPAMDEKREKGEKRENAMDKIRQKYGRAAIVHGSVIDTDIGIYEKKPQPAKAPEAQEPPSAASDKETRIPNA